MTSTTATATSNGELELVLPVSVSGRVQLARLAREVEALENDFESQKARNTSPVPKIPVMSQPLVDCIELNKVDISNGQARMRLKKALINAKDKAPIMHFTFATEADPRSIRQLVTYVRKEIHPQALISIGLQPALVGGAYLRTPNQVHDFSLKARLHDKRSLIVDALAAGIEKAQAKAEQAAAQPTSAAAQPAVMTAAGQPVVAGNAPALQVQATVQPAQTAQAQPLQPTRLVVAQPARQQPQAQPTGWPEKRPSVAASVTRQAVQPVARQATNPAATPARGSHAK